jgi:hypothetical protein
MLRELIEIKFILIRLQKRRKNLQLDHFNNNFKVFLILNFGYLNIIFFHL